MNLPKNQVLHGNCLEVMKTLPDNSIDAIVSDPPYGLGDHQPTREDIIKYLQGSSLNTGGDFMGKDWEIPPVPVWEQCFRILKPGGHLLAFAGTRTFDMMSVGIRAAGFEDRDTIASMFGPSVLQWIYGAGFPKSLDIAKAIDKMLKVKGKLIRTEERYNEASGIVNAGRGAGAREFIKREIREPESPEAKKWAGWGTALKPAWEPILCFRKPPGQTIIRNVMENGTGALNIEGCRVGNEPRVNPPAGNKPGGNSLEMSVHGMPGDAAPTVTTGRWPANIVVSHTPACTKVEMAEFPLADDAALGLPERWDCAENCPARKIDEQSGDSKSSSDPSRFQGLTKFSNGHYVNSKAAAEMTNDLSTAYGDEGGASRYFTGIAPEASFFYTAKASKSDRNQGLDVQWQPGILALRDDLSEEDLEKVYAAFPNVYRGDLPEIFSDVQVPGTVRQFFRQVHKGDRGNMHVTVKPVALMRWLVRLVCPKKGLVLDPYAGSGTTLVAAAEEGCDFIGIELDPAYYDIAAKRAVNVVEAREIRETETSLFDLMMSMGGGD
jgi:DNA modification methylase